MSVEMRVVLVGEADDQHRAQQQAIDQPTTAPGGQSNSSTDISSGGTDASSPASPIDSIGQLITSIDLLIKSVDSLREKMDGGGSATSGPAKPPKPPPVIKPPEQKPGGVEGFVSRLDDIIQDRLQFYGLKSTNVGRVVTAASRGIRNLATSAARFGGLLTGRGAASAAGTASTTAAAGTGAASGGAAAAGGAAGAAAAASSVAAPLIAVGVAAAGAALTLAAFVKAVRSAADELEDMSPAIASVRAQGEARRELARLDRAQRTGAGLAQVEAARLRLSQAMYETQTRVLELLLKAAPSIEMALDALTAILRAVEMTTAIAEQTAAIAAQTAASLTPGNADDLAAAAWRKAADDNANKTAAAFASAVKAVFTDDSQAIAPDPWLNQLLQLDFDAEPKPGGGRPAPAFPRFP